MARAISVEDALRCAVLTAQEQPGQVPAVPAGWIEQAKEALDEESEGKISICTDSILLAHAQYRADVDINGWLHDLRTAMREAR